MTIEHSLSKEEVWPALPLADWHETRMTLHMWTQIVGKVRLALSPRVNQWWEVPLYVCARGLTTSPIPYGTGIFEVNFDFVSHTLDIVTSWNEKKTIHLFTRTVAGFYREFMDALHSLGITVKIWPMPVEIPNPIRFDLDVTHARYDPAYAHRFWRILVTLDGIFKEFRAEFIGKASPVHFFWGSFDLAASRFSGRLAPPRPGADSSDERSLFARSDQCGVVARLGRYHGAYFLRIRRAGAFRISRRTRKAVEGGLQHAVERIFASL